MTSNDTQEVRKANLTDDERNGVLQSLLSAEKEGKLPKGVIGAVAAKFNVHRHTISRIWTKAKADFKAGMKFADVRSRIKGNSGRKRKNRLEMQKKIESVELRKRSTLRSIAAASETPLSTLHKLLKEGFVKRVSNTVKPYLTQQNKIERLRFAVSMLVPGTSTFSVMHDVVHVDEKWFYMTKVKKNFYILPDEAECVRQVKSKRFITKVMFLVAVARPRWDPHRKTFFDGKIGLWPCVTKEPAKRSSKNRDRGTLITKPYEIKQEQYQRLILEKVIPAIQEKWPAGSKDMAIKIQHDNAPPHRNISIEAVKAASGELNISMMFQPPNSPDFNVLDLGFFHSIQALQYQESPSNIDELISVVEKSFADLSAETLDNVFYSLQKAFESSMKVGGGNDYKLAHMGKQQLRREGTLPLFITCDLDTVKAAMEAIEAQ